VRFKTIPRTGGRRINPRRTRSIACALWIIAFAFVISLAEGAIRLGKLIAPESALLHRLVSYAEFEGMASSYYAPSSFNPFTLAADYQGYDQSQQKPGTRVAVRTNALGFRGPEIAAAKPPGTKRVLVLGDSYTFGLFLEDHQAYPRVIETALRRQGHDVQVINAAYADGFCPDEHHSWLKNVGLDLSPDVVIYGFFIGNDMDCADTRNWSRLDEQGLPVQIRDPHLRVEKGVIIEDADTPDSIPWYLRVPGLRRSYVFVSGGRLFDRAARLVDPGWALSGWEDPFPWIFRPKSTPEMAAREDLFFRIVDGMRTASESSGARFLVAMIPINFQVHEDLLPLTVPLGITHAAIRRDFFPEAKARFASLGIENLDLLEELRRRPGRFFPDNGEAHFNADGAAAAGEALAERLALEFLDAR
jgi:hypothetical protein